MKAMIIVNDVKNGGYIVKLFTSMRVIPMMRRKKEVAVADEAGLRKILDDIVSEIEKEKSGLRAWQ